MITFELEYVTPELARDYLAMSHEENREVAYEKVQQIAWDIKGGRWRVNNHLLAFDRNGKLVDGQHRLRAIVKAGVPVEVGVMRGVRWHD